MRASSAEDAFRDAGEASPSPLPGARRAAPTFPRPRGLPEGGPDGGGRRAACVLAGRMLRPRRGCCCGADAGGGREGEPPGPARCEVAAEDGGCRRLRGCAARVDVLP